MKTRRSGLRTWGVPKLSSTRLVLQDVGYGIAIFTGSRPTRRLGLVFGLFAHGWPQGVRNDLEYSDCFLFHVICGEALRDFNILVQWGLVSAPLGRYEVRVHLTDHDRD